MMDYTIKFVFDKKKVCGVVSLVFLEDKVGGSEHCTPEGFIDIVFGGTRYVSRHLEDCGDVIEEERFFKDGIRSK